MLDTKLGVLQKALAGENANGDLERQRDWPNQAHSDGRADPNHNY